MFDGKWHENPFRIKGKCLVSAGRFDVTWVLPSSLWYSHEQVYKLPDKGLLVCIVWGFFGQFLFWVGCVCVCVCVVTGFFHSDKALDMEVIQCSLGSLTLSCCCSVSPYHSSGSTFGSWPEGKTSVSEQDQTSICFYAISASVHCQLDKSFFPGQN